MSRYTARIDWSRGDAAFVDNRYPRRHEVVFDGGHAMPASSSPQVVRAPFSDPAAVDPEEMFVASLASCHMLWFLSIAAGRGFRVDRYEDDAEGEMARDGRGKMAMTRVTLRPRIAFAGEPSPTRDELDAMHHRAHDECFIANSVRTDVRVEPRDAPA